MQKNRFVILQFLGNFTTKKIREITSCSFMIIWTMWFHEFFSEMLPLKNSWNHKL